MKFLKKHNSFIERIMRKALTYIKIIIPIALIIALFVFKQYFLNELSNSIASGNAPPGTENYYSEYDLSTSQTQFKGSLLEFGAKNCSACRQMAKVLEEIRVAFPRELQIEFINTTTKEGLTKGKKFGLIAIPMQILLDNEGKLVFRHTGYISTADLSQKIKHHLNIKEKSW